MYNSVQFASGSIRSPQKSLRITRGSLGQLLVFPASIFDHAVNLKDQYNALILEANDQHISSAELLIARFLDFIAGRIDDSADDRIHNRKVLSCALDQFEADILHGKEIHAVAATLPDAIDSTPSFIRYYYHAISALGRPIQRYEPNLLRAARTGKVRIFAIFGGQGNNESYFDELRDLYSTYQYLIHGFISDLSNHLRDLHLNNSSKKQLSRGLEPLKWLQSPSEEPDTEYLLSAPLSFPLIGLLQLSHYALTCKILGIGPGELRGSFKGLSGHSQGIITAVAVSQADSWGTFFISSKKALTLLYWIGLRSQAVYPQTTLAPSLIKESLEAGEGSPTPMLSVRKIPKDVLQLHINSTNQFLPPEGRVGIGLDNGANNYVVCGPATSLCGLNSRLRQSKSTLGLDQARVPFRERKLDFTNDFLPITAPFHSPYLLPVHDMVMDDVHNLYIARDSLDIPVYSTKDGKDLRYCDEPNIVSDLIRMITANTLHWKLATHFPAATHLLDFGPGGTLGIGYLTQKFKDGTGVRIISTTSINAYGSNTQIGSKDELFDRSPQSAVKIASNWLQEHSPRVTQNEGRGPFLDTRFSRILGLPPIMVAGMTPCTVPWDFVAATMNAGYHIELAGGGYRSPQALADAIRKITDSVMPGRGVTVNLIYANPAAIGWQIPLLRQLRGEGVPIDGLTIGAGVPTIGVATDYIQNLGLRHIAFKPGSLESIYKVIEIAKSNPDFPIILQWTGGRGGGHHSFEDFHQPLIQTYSKIRECWNIILVAGSGFGGATDTYPYLTGTWTAQFEHAPMPFDAILYGSRMMTAKEAHTSSQVKQAIVDTEGIDDSHWEKTYKGSSGGVITVLSEMGEPIHKVATRGVLFWAEMDKTIFSLDRSKRVAALQDRRDYIIKKLNDDFQKVWFGRTAKGKAVEIDEMTYSEVLYRLAELLYIKSTSRWIDVSYKALLGDFARRVEERFTLESVSSAVPDFVEISDPEVLVQEIVNNYPRCGEQLVSAEDTRYLIVLCQRRDQKPVPFIPALDENFEYWFKKDSLWQSEDIEAVVGNDVGRTCILQGPVAVKHSIRADEPIKDILDGIHAAHLQMLADDESLQTVETDNEESNSLHETSKVVTPVERPDQCTMQHRITHSSHSTLPATEPWLKMLAGNVPSWTQAFFTVNSLVQGKRRVSNPLKRLFAPRWDIEVLIAYPNEPAKTLITWKELGKMEQLSDIMELRATSDRTIELVLIEHRSALGTPVKLGLHYTYHPDAGFAPIREVMDQRNDRINEFYWKLWFGSIERISSDASLTGTFHGGTFVVKKQEVTQFVNAVQNPNEAYIEKPGKHAYAPMDFAIRAAWKVMTMPLFLVKGSLLDLIHLSNCFRVFPNTKMLEVNDVLDVSSTVRAVRILSSGKMVEVCGIISRESVPVMEVTSRFLYRGNHTDYDGTFQRKSEVPMVLHIKSRRQVTLLKSREWFHPLDPELDLQDLSLCFRLESLMRFDDQEGFSSIETQGKVLLRSSAGAETLFGTVWYSHGRSAGNPIMDFLDRHGFAIEQPQMLENPISLVELTKLEFQAPASNEFYALVSGDFNPIHVSRTFSTFAGLDGTITHGMYVSARVRGFVEIWAAENNVGLVKRFECSFDDMIFPNDHIGVNLFHVGMIAGRKIIKIEATKNGTEKVLTATAEVEQPASAYMFTGQGSQAQGMGMDLYARSGAARDIWDRADNFYLKHYGFSILDIVRTNPKSLKIYFGGSRGDLIRHNYIRMMVEKLQPDGQMRFHKVFEEINESTDSYTFRSPQGLLYSTQFAQPALTLVAQASYAVIQEKGLVPHDCSYAGHSLGEYAALSTFADIMSLEDLISIVFYRGLTMQLCVERDASGRTSYSMCAFNPSKVGKGFNENALNQLLQVIQQETDWLLEIVNLNIQDQQYVCAGDLRALDTLISVTSHLNSHKTNGAFIESDFLPLVRIHAAAARSKSQPLKLERSQAAVPLEGIDVPFHSSHLKSGIRPFRTALRNAIKQEDIDPCKLLHRYIPNLTGKPFEITKDYFEEVGELTQSLEIKKILQEWDN